MIVAAARTRIGRANKGFAVRSQNLAETAIAEGFWAREITLPDGIVVSPTTASAPA